MRTELIDDDINIFLLNNSVEFSKIIKKRIKNWHTAVDYKNCDFMAILLLKVSENHCLNNTSLQYTWSDIFRKLESLSFVFKSSHYLPNFDLSTNCNSNMREHYKALVQNLVNRKVVFDSKLIEPFFDKQLDGIHETIISMLRSLSPDFDKVILKQKVKKDIYYLVSDIYEMMLLQSPPKKNNMGNNNGGDYINSQINNYLIEQDRKTKFISDFIDKHYLSKEDAKELLLSFRPSGEVMQNLDRKFFKQAGTTWFEYMKALKDGTLFSRDYFTKQQLYLMDKIQNKFYVYVLK